MGGLGECFGHKIDTYILDVHGRGLSSAEGVIVFAKELGLKSYLIVGHSMGGFIGARAAAAEPEGLTCLVMVDPSVLGPSRRQYPSNLNWYVDSMALARKGCTAA